MICHKFLIQIVLLQDIILLYRLKRAILFMSYLNFLSVPEINIGQKRILPIRQRQSAREQTEKPFSAPVALWEHQGVPEWWIVTGPGRVGLYKCQLHRRIPAARSLCRYSGTASDHHRRLLAHAVGAQLHHRGHAHQTARVGKGETNTYLFIFSTVKLRFKIPRSEQYKYLKSFIGKKVNFKLF